MLPWASAFLHGMSDSGPDAGRTSCINKSAASALTPTVRPRHHQRRQSIFALLDGGGMKGLFERRVLVRDDDDEGMRNFVELLEDAGADIVLAATGAEALKRIEAHTVTAPS
jgi:PleD family two-component response regulator